MAVVLVGCKSRQDVNNPETTPQSRVDCGLYIGECGERPDWDKPMEAPARFTEDELDPYTTPESLEADCVGENQLRIIWMKKDQCDPEFEVSAILEGDTITLSCRDTAWMIADCICIFPLYFDFDSLAYGIYNIVVDSMTHTIDFQADMEPYKYEYEE